MLDEIIDIVLGLVEVFVLTIIIGVLGILASAVSMAIILKILEMF